MEQRVWVLAEDCAIVAFYRAGELVHLLVSDLRHTRVALG